MYDIRLREHIFITPYNVLLVSQVTQHVEHLNIFTNVHFPSPLLKSLFRALLSFFKSCLFFSSKYILDTSFLGIINLFPWHVEQEKQS